MKLKELAKETFGKNMNNKFIGIVKVKDGVLQKCYPDFADEYLETHGNMEVYCHYYSQSKKTLLVALDPKDIFLN